MILLGSSEYLRLISYSDGPPTVLCRLPITAEAYRVNFNEDGSLAITAHSDGTLRWRLIARQGNTCAFKTLLTLRVSQVGDGSWTWTAWLPDGTHAQGFNARDGLEWQSLSASGAVIITPFERLQSAYSPDAIMRALDATHVPAPERPIDRDQLIAPHFRKVQLRCCQIRLQSEPTVSVFFWDYGSRTISIGQSSWPSESTTHRRILPGVARAIQFPSP